MSALKAPSDCVLYARALHAYVDGELSVDHTAEIEAHVARCSSCFDEVAQHRAVRLSLRRTCAAKAPTSLHDRMTAIVAAEASRSEGHGDGAPDDDASARPGRGRWTGARAGGFELRDVGGARPKLIPMKHVAALAVAAGVVFAVGMSRDRRGQGASDAGESAHANVSTPSPVLAMSFDDLVEDLVAMHASPPPPETTNPDELKRFDPFVGVPVRRPADPTFQPLGVRYDGARMHMARGKHAAVLFYSIQNGHRATMYVFDARDFQLQRTRLQPRVVKQRSVYVGKVRGYSFAATERSGVGYALATDLDDELSASVVAAVQ